MRLSFYLLLLLHFIFLNLPGYTQDNSAILRSEALKLMKDERFGEAIDQWNKYISANPNSSEGFNLRGVCYENRSNYEYAVYDYRTARKLKPGDDEIRSNLNRATSNWYKLLYNKIEGHKREIAINPGIPKNYLEIGKCYKNLGEWNEAEIWYDMYLEKEFASSDEIIRYSEILAKNNHIAKGEPILKKYTDRFPDDHRLWSRYGYFVMWLGKNKLAIDAFTKALDLRPYFKEALDGLDLAKGKGYIYSVNDTTGRFDYGVPKTPFEYAIDKFYRQLKKRPDNDEIRFKLIDELIKANRYEEAFQQLEILSPRYSNENRFNELREKVISLRKSYYANRINYLEDILRNNPGDKKSLLELARFYTYNGDYVPASNLYKEYLKNNPDDKDVYYSLAEVLMWQNNLCEAADIADKLVALKPENENYLLLAAKINFWLNRDPDYTYSVYRKVLEKNPDNREAMFGAASILLNKNNPDEAKALIDRLETIDSNSVEYTGLIQRYFSLIEQNQISKNYDLLEKARLYETQKDYYSSIRYFKRSLQDYENRDVRLELANVYIADGQPEEAEKIFESLLRQGNDPEIQKRLAKLHLWNRDSLIALKEFKQLNKINPSDIETKLMLGDAYLQAGQTTEARKIYEELFSTSPGSHIIKTRLNWLGGSDKFSFEKFPTFIQLKPGALFFTDNTGFDYANYGLGFDLGVTNFLTIGFSGFRGKLSSDNYSLRFNQLKGTGYIKFSEIFSGSASFGRTFFQNNFKENIIEAGLTAKKKKLFNISAFINYSDAAFLLYSPFLVNSRLNTYLLGINAEYIFKNNLIVSGKYNYIDVSDDNSGNQFTARLGKIFNEEISGGYEYYFYSFDHLNSLYWSPKNFEAHSLWIDWILYEDESVNFSIGGKAGLIPQNDYILSDFYASFSYQLVNSLLFQARFNTASSFRSNTGYRANSIIGSLIWTL